MAFSSQQAETWLLFVDGIQAPNPDGSIVRGRGDDERISRRRGEVVDILKFTY
jgi:hypothetical protein